MHLSRVLIAAALLSIPAAASAGTAVELRHNGAGEHCQGDGGKKGAKLLEKFGSALGGEDTRKAWKSLRDAGEPGCDAIAAWLKEGAPGEETAGIADAAALLVKNGNDSHVAAALMWLGDEDPDVLRGILGALEYRLGVLDPDSTAAIAADTRKGVGDAAVSVFIGYHSVGTMKTVYGIPVYEEIAYWGSVTAPPDHYVKAVGTLLQGATPDRKEDVAKYAGRHYREAHTGQDAWAPFLVAMVDSMDKESQKAANIAAKHLAWGEPAGIDEAVTKIISSGNAETMEHFLDGFEERLGEGRGTAATIARLETIAAAGDKRAPKIAKKFAKKVQ